MIALLLVTLAHAGTAGLQVGALGWETSARHAVVPSLGAWVTHAPEPYALTIEAAAARHRTRTPAYAYQSALLRVSAVAGLTAGRRATRVHFGLGPALSARIGALSHDGEPTRFTEPGLGVRGRLALEGPLSERFGFSWHVAGTTRGRRVDVDTALGLGVHW